MSGCAENDYQAMIKGLFDTFTRDKTHNYDTLQNAVAHRPTNYTHDGVMEYLHFMQRYWHLMVVYDPNGKAWAYQLYKAMSKVLPNALYEVLRAETRRNCPGGQAVDYRNALKNGIACLIATVNQTEDDYAYVDPSFGRGGVDAQVAKFFSNPIGYMEEQKSLQPQSSLAQIPKYVARRTTALQATMTSNSKRARRTNLAIANLAQPEKEPSVGPELDGLNADEETWFYHANASSELSNVQESVRSHVQEHGSWPTNVTLAAAGEPVVREKVAWNQSIIPLPELSTSICPFCPEAPGHGGKNCPKLPYEKFRQVNALKLCRMCLQPGHVLRDCKYKRICTKCDKYWHHEAMCNKKFVIDKAKVAAQVEAEVLKNGLPSSDNRRKVQVLLVDGTYAEQYEQTIVANADTGVEVVCYVNLEGNPILPGGMSLVPSK
jgi:hypothetical protein